MSNLFEFNTANNSVQEGQSRVINNTPTRNPACLLTLIIKRATQLCSCGWSLVETNEVTWNYLFFLPGLGHGESSPNSRKTTKPKVIKVLATHMLILLVHGGKAAGVSERTTLTELSQSPISSFPPISATNPRE